MANTIQIKRGLEENLSSAGVLAGELKFTTDTKKLYVGNGTSNICLNDIIIPVTSLPTSNVSENSFYLLTVDVGDKKAGMYYATISGSAISWHAVGTSVTWANITGNISDNTALWTILGNVATLKTTSKALTGAINELYDTIQGMSSGMTYKGSVDSRTDLPTSGMSNGDLYFVIDETMNVVWNSTKGDWDDLGGAIDISGKVDKTTTIADIPLSSNIPAADLKNALGISSVYTYKGQVATVADLDAIPVKAVGDAYYVVAAAGTYAWNGTAWQSIGQAVDLTLYQKKQDDTLTTTAKTVVGAIAELKTDGVGNKIKFVFDDDEYKLKAQLYKADGVTLISETAEIDLPMEEMIVSIEYVSSIPSGEHAGEPGLKITLKSGSVTYAPLSGMISGMVTETGTQTLTNKTIDADDNTITDLTTSNLKSGTVSTSIAASSSASDSKLASEKAVRTELDKKLDTEPGVSQANKFVIVDNTGAISYTTSPTFAVIDCGTF